MQPWLNKRFDRMRRRHFLFPCWGCCQRVNLARYNGTGSPPETQWTYYTDASPASTNETISQIVVVGDYGWAFGINSGGTHKVQNDGTLDTQFTGVIGIHDVDSSGYMYNGGGSIIRKYNADGSLQWLKSTSVGTVNVVRVDSSGNVYAGGLESIGNITLQKWNSAGTSQWTAQVGNDIGGGTSGITDMRVDSSGNVYCLYSIYDSGGTGDFLEKINSSGSSVWTYPGDTANYSQTGSQIRLDSSGNVFVVVYDSGGSLVAEKINSSGSRQYQFAADGAVFDIDSSENWYFIGNGIPVKKRNSSGTLQWTAADIFYDNPRCIEVDSYDRVWVGGREG